MGLVVIFLVSIVVTKDNTSLSDIINSIQKIDKSKSADLSSGTESEVNQKQAKTVVIDPGHGGYDPGSIGRNGTIEKNINLSISLKLGVLLEKKGFNVVYTRASDNVTWPSDNKKDLAARATISNRASADVFISIHLNTFHMQDVKGTETYYNKGSTKGKHLAELIQNQIVKDVKSNDRGVQPGNFSVLKKVTAPAILIELGYISSKSEEALLNSSSYQDKISEAIAISVYNYLSIEM